MEVSFPPVTFRRLIQWSFRRSWEGMETNEGATMLASSPNTSTSGFQTSRSPSKTPPFLSQHLATQSLESGHHIHKALAWVEVAIVAVYGAELFHLVLDDGGFHPANLIAALVFGILGLGIVRPWKH